MLEATTKNEEGEFVPPWKRGPEAQLLYKDHEFDTTSKESEDDR